VTVRTSTATVLFAAIFLLPVHADAQPTFGRDLTKDLPLFLAEAERCLWSRSASQKIERVDRKGASGGACVWIESGGQLVMRVVIHRPGPHYVYLRCPSREPARPIQVQLGDTVASAFRLVKDMGDSWHWARVGPFEMTEKTVDCPLIVKPTTAYSINVDLVAVTPSPVLQRRDGSQEYFTDLTYWKVPGPDILKDCKSLDVYPPAYMTKHYIVQAPEERIYTAVGWAKHVEENAYSTMIEVLGYDTPIDLHAVVFSDEARHPAFYMGIGEFQDTGLRASKIFARCSLLNPMPPYRVTGGLAWETIHAILDEPKRQANWRQVLQQELLDLVFELELYKRLGLQSEIDAIWKKWVVGKPNTRYSVLCTFWKEYGWGPYQKLLLKLHENPDFKPVFTEASFVYELSLGAGKDVSPFFIERGWTVDEETKAKIKAEVGATE
jgi:hypothetical protein